MVDLTNENVIHVKKENIEYLQFKKLLEFDDIISHAITLRKYNINYIDYTQENKYNRISSYDKICEELNLEKENIILCYQKHTDNVECVFEAGKKENPYDWQYDNTDGVITNKKKLVLVSTIADCIPLLFFDPVTKTIANVHSGWKGTTLKIAQKTVEKMVKEYGVKPCNLICAIGPSIGKCHFEVEDDVYKLFKDSFDDMFNRYHELLSISSKNGVNKYNIDTVLINQYMLEEMGLKRDNILKSGICTVCKSDLIHSFRVDKEKSGRNLAVIELKK